MMKKTLLSIMTMAVLASSTVAHSAVEEVSIPVEADVLPVVGIVDVTTGLPLTQVTKLVKDPASLEHAVTMGVVLLTNGHQKADVKIKNPLVLANATMGEELITKDITLAGKALTTQNTEFDAGDINIPQELTIVVEEMAGGAKVGTYTGNLELTVESKP
ncbi:alpha-related fimbriae minor subunit 1 [Yersinia thracica]|uniref:Alpha-related fimbriae minor subunit 1 n=2 Tax=Yersinia thracica TaxID=2890319 RepID=A0A0T9Q5K0_9GAMM|nr:CS1 type fimbrial major subunit [Yersinia thracica]CNH97213.1 alpha-related fimbriae minor subunit 1 [Yersinia thracica]